MQRYKQLSPFNVRFTRTNKTCTEKNELQYSIQNDTAYNTTSTIPPASFPVVLGDFGCDVINDVICLACRENSLGTRLQFLHLRNTSVIFGGLSLSFRRGRIVAGYSAVTGILQLTAEYSATSKLYPLKELDQCICSYPF